MNFQEICEIVAEEVNGRPLTFSSVSLDDEADPFKRRVIRAVNTAYMEILLFSEHWKFLNKRGTLLAIASGKREYSISCVKTIDWTSLYLTKAGATARYPVYEESYLSWKERERAEPNVAGIPLYLIRSDVPDKWILWPTPDNDYTLNGNLQYKPSFLESASDEPIWDSQYHELLVWLAVRHLEGRVKTQDEIVSGLNATEAQRNVALLFKAFCSQYLPSILGATER